MNLSLIISVEVYSKTSKSFFSFFLSIFTIFVFIFDDFERILGLIMQLMFWLSPVIYFIRDIKSNFSLLLALNPFHIFYELIFLCFYPERFDEQIFYISVCSFLVFFILMYFLLKNFKSKVGLFL